MPHAVNIPSPGFQAIILCGPGSSFPTFTSSPDDSPKALLPIANRPMVWYPIDLCHRMGVTDITLIAPPSAMKTIETAMNTNPHLTSLPLPKPDLLAPRLLTHTTGTAAILRLPEVKAIIKGDFVVLPCDIVSEISANQLIELWMVKQAGRCGTGDAALHGERQGGLGVWYDTKGEMTVKGEETDFIATAPVDPSPLPPRHASLAGNTSRLVCSMPMDTFKDQTEAKKAFQVRHSLVRQHARVRMLSSHRDAHIYLFPAWTLDMIDKNEHMDSIGEDVVGWWAKATWQNGLGEKLGLRSVLTTTKLPSDDENPAKDGAEVDEINSDTLSTTMTTNESMSQSTTPSKEPLKVPPILAYIHPTAAADTSSKLPFIRRVDTAPLLLAASLALAKLPSVEEAGADASPLAHATKVAHAAGVAARTTVTRPDCLLAENVTVEEKCAVKETVIGANCTIRTGAKLTRCLLMDGVVVGRNCKLIGCVLGRRSEIGDDCVLLDCEVQENLLVEPRTEDKGAKLMSSDGMEATEQEMLDFEEEIDDVEAIADSNDSNDGSPDVS